MAKSKPVVILEGKVGHMEVTRPDGTKRFVGNASDMMSEMLYCSQKWPGAVMRDRRGWKFGGEA